VKLRKKSEQNRLNKMATQPVSIGLAELTTATTCAAAELNETPPSSPKKGSHRTASLSSFHF
jgi:hypothetical protein